MSQQECSCALIYDAQREDEDTVDDRDRAFLEDMQQTISLNHIVSVRALRQSLADAGAEARGAYFSTGKPDLTQPSVPPSML